MIRNRFVFAALAFFALAPFAHSQSEDPKGAADRAVQWLVAQQQADGSYGGNVSTTALTLYAMSVCHRQYRADDGPFMRKAIAYLGTKLETEKSPEALAATQQIFSALRVPLQESWKKKFMEASGTLARNPFEVASPSVEELLKKQSPDGSWGSSVEDTARALLTISVKGAAKKSKGNLDEAMKKGTAFLLGKREGNQWGFPGKPDAGITGLAVTALLAASSVQDPAREKAIEEGLAYLASLAKKDGSIYEKGYINYTTCIAVMAMKESGKESFQPLLEAAQKYLVSLQADEDKGYLPTDKFYGGIGYGGSQRTDLSNTQFALEALHATGLPKDHELYRKTLVFLSRSQNHSETNSYTVEIDGVSYVPGNDGGGAYYPGNSFAGYDSLPDGRKIARSYGSMTYALLRGYLFSGVPKDDPRMKAAFDWIRANFTVHDNPGFDKREGPQASMQGYFYYLLTMAKALDAFGEENISLSDGTKLRWREVLREKLLSLQKPDGSWVNEFAPRWYEGNPVLCTAYAMAALKYCK